MTRWMLCGAALTIALAQVVRATPIVVNPGFESPGGIGEGVSSYTYPFHDPGVTVEGWTFAASEGGIPDGSYDGLSRPGLAGSFTTLTGYEGNQVAFLEVLGSFSQEIGGFNAGTFTVSFLAGGRYYYADGVYHRNLAPMRSR